MGYVRVLEHTDNRLHLSRAPGLMSWAIVAGLAALGLGAAYFSTHNNIYEALFVIGAIVVGIQLMDDWEDCTFDKVTGCVTISKLSSTEKILSFFSNSFSSQKINVDELSEIVEVNIDEEDLKFAGRGHCVLLKFAAGYELGVTESFTLDDITEHEGIAELIRKFLGLENQDYVDNTSSEDEDVKTK